MPALFREEAVKARLIDIGVPLGITGRWSWFYTIWVVVAIIAGLIIVVFGEYARKSRVNGFLAPDNGIIKIVTPHAGWITDLKVTEGQHVIKGDVLCVVDVGAISAAGRSGDLIVQNLKDRHRLIAEELARLAIVQKSDAAKLDESIRSLKSQIDTAERELVVRQNFLRLTKNEYERNHSLSDKGYFSITQMEQAEQNAVSAEMQIVSLERTIAQNRGDLAQAVAEQEGLADKQANDRSQLQRTLAEIDQQIFQIEEQRYAVIQANETGTATRVTAKLGAAADPATPLLTIVPDSSVLEANLYVPSTAAGFIHQGTRVLLRYQAYPYQKFGLQDAVVTSLSRTAVDPKELPFPAKSDDPLYLVIATLSKSTITAYGKEEKLQAGAKFDADMVLENRKIWEWALEPLIAAQQEFAK